MSALHLPARDIPVPSSVSLEAQSFLSMGSLHDDLMMYPAIDDTEGWRTYVRNTEGIIGADFIARADKVDVAVEQREIGGVTVNVATPAGLDQDDERVVLDIHGGGLILGGRSICTATTKLAAATTGLRTWGPDYRMAPDHPYPAALDDCLVVYRALLEERPPERVVVTGMSAGGNLSAALVVRAQDEGVPPPAALVLQTPELDLTESGDSFETNLGIDTVLGRLGPMNELYANGHDLAHPYLSPLFADVTGFPPTMLTAGTRDLFLSNAVRMHRALRKAGVEAELHILEAAPHGGFQGTAPEDADLALEAARFICKHCPPS